MAIWKLSNEVWWGNCDSIGSQNSEFESVGSLLCVADNLHDVSHQHNPFHKELSRTPYFRLPWDENQEISDDYFDQLISVIDHIDKFSMFPLLVYCRAGQVRSPMVAAVASSYIESMERLGNCSFNYWKEKAFALRSDINWNKEYPISLKEKYWSEESENDEQGD